MSHGPRRDPKGALYCQPLVLVAKPARGFKRPPPPRPLPPPPPPLRQLTPALESQSVPKKAPYWQRHPALKPKAWAAPKPAPAGAPSAPAPEEAPAPDEAPAPEEAPAAPVVAVPVAPAPRRTWARSLARSKAAWIAAREASLAASHAGFFF